MVVVHLSFRSEALDNDGIDVTKEPELANSSTHASNNSRIVAPSGAVRYETIRSQLVGQVGIEPTTKGL